jgi:flagellar motor switch protein FliM
MPATQEITQPETAASAPEVSAPAASRTFRQGGLLAESALRKLRSQQEEFARVFGSRVSLYLRTDFSVAVAGVQTVSFQKFVERIATPAHLTLLKIEPLRGIGLLEIPPQLGLRIVDRQLGGTGNIPNADRALTEIETALLDQVSEILLTEWCTQWHEQQELKAVLLGHEFEVRFLNAIARETVMLELAFEVAMGEHKERFRLGLPHASFETLIQRLTDGGGAQEVGPALAGPALARWNPRFDEVPVALRAVCDGFRLTARQLATLKVGDSLPVEPQRFNAVTIHIGTAAKFVGTLGTSEGHWAVAVTEKLEA